ncbi:MAG TPA: hypothetical protein VFQ60_01505 [Patescibacteria group bacterium]|nr:hypothetical protein [Patescibacteria group bacterium]
MEFKRSSDRVWSVIDGRRICARVYLDHLYQVDELVLFTKDFAERRKIKEVAASHVVQYCRKRRITRFGGLMISELRRPELSNKDSDLYMDPKQIPPEIKELSDQDLDRAIVEFVQITIAEYQILEEVLAWVRAEVKRGTRTSVEFESLNESILGTLVKCTSGGRPFRFWRWADKPQSEALYLVPRFHPYLAGKRAVIHMNGDTDAYIGKHDACIRSIQAPTDSPQSSGSAFGSTYSRMQNPFFAQGKSFIFELSDHIYLSRAGADALKEMVLSALEHGDTYIEVIAGFDPPYTYPTNLKPKVGRVRGSEPACVWQYLVLKRDNALDGSFVPPWFLREGWLEIYREEVQKVTPDLAKYL